MALKSGDANEQAARQKAAELARAKLETAARARKAEELKEAGEAVAAAGREKLDAAVAAARAAAADAARVKTYTVKGGDTLSAIAKAELGDGARWKEIYEMNEEAIGADPDKIKVGMVLSLPK